MAGEPFNPAMMNWKPCCRCKFVRQFGPEDSWWNSLTAAAKFNVMKSFAADGEESDNSKDAKQL